MQTRVCDVSQTILCFYEESNGLSANVDSVAEGSRRVTTRTKRNLGNRIEMIVLTKLPLKETTVLSKQHVEFCCIENGK
jgi:hypothetical protein